MEEIIVKANKHNLYAYYGRENGAQLTNLNNLFRFFAWKFSLRKVKTAT